MAHGPQCEIRAATTYRDHDGAEQTLPAGTYEVMTPRGHGAIPVYLHATATGARIEVPRGEAERLYEDGVLVYLTEEAGGD